MGIVGGIVGVNGAKTRAHVISLADPHLVSISHSGDEIGNKQGPLWKDNDNSISTQSHDQNLRVFIVYGEWQSENRGN